MKINSHFKKLDLLLYFLAIVFLCYLFLAPMLEERLNSSSNSVLSETVEVSALIASCPLSLTIYPEKRIPTINNWDTVLNIQIYEENTTNFRGEVTASTNSVGFVNVNLCDYGIFLNAGSYDFYIKGLSHLRQKYSSIVGFGTAGGESINLTLLPNSNLLAGSTGVVVDNVINMLDLATQVNSYKTNNNVNDLNQDGQVNVLDISNTLYNFYVVGDCSQKDIDDGFCTN